MSRNGEAATMTPIKRPDIVYALPPKRSSKKRERVEHPNMPVTVQALSPQHIERKQRAAALEAKTSRLVDTRKPSPLDDVDPEEAHAAADRLWKEMVQAVNAQRDQPASGGPNRRRSRRR
jgi:hypothetical protein